MANSIYLSTVGKLLQWARSSSLWYYPTGSACCADEVLSSLGCRYDLERFGCVQQAQPEQSDLLIVTGVISRKAAPHLKAVYDAMLAPRYVISVGSCANCGGAFAPEYSYAAIAGADQIFPVDVYVPGCPPRPEAIMNGLITLQEKISGRSRPASTG
jgi:NADH-quinone oxidoreductase B subunit